jgi:hypothetical protein
VLAVLIPTHPTLEGIERFGGSNRLAVSGAGSNGGKEICHLRPRKNSCCPLQHLRVRVKIRVGVGI